jgi:hypothetical protein
VGQQDSVARGPLGRAGVARRVTASSSSEQRTSGSVDQAKLSSASRFDSRIDYLIYSHSVFLYLYIITWWSFTAMCISPLTIDELA